MKRLRLIISFGFSTLLLFNCAMMGVASAHVLKTDNGISGVLHIEPNDNPQAGQPTVLDESFGDSRDKFSLQDCNCQLLVEQNNHVLRAINLKPAISDATLESKVVVKFPNIGIYDVVIKGNSKDGMFNRFRLDYSVRVASKSRAPQLLLVGGAVAAIGVGGYGFKNLRRHKKNPVR